MFHSILWKWIIPQNRHKLFFNQILYPTVALFTKLKLVRQSPGYSMGMGEYYAQIIRAGKLEARPFFFSNFKGTPSQVEHKTNFSGLKISKMALSGQSDGTALFLAVRYTL